MFALAVFSQTAVTAFSQDNDGLRRLTKRDDLFGYEAIGRLDLGQDGFCTGVLIAPDLVLTAAHCLRSAVAAGHTRGFVFRAGLRDGKIIAARAVKHVVMHPEYEADQDMTVANIRADVGLAQLDRPIPSSIAAPFLVDHLPPAKRKVSVISYAMGREDALSRQAECSVLGRQDGLLAFDCNVTFGSSGAPIFDDSERRIRIVSLVSAGSNTHDDTIVFGAELVARVAEVKQALRAGKGVIGKTDFKPRRLGVGQSNDTGARFVRP